MIELVTEGVVLSRESGRRFDDRYIVFTKEAGKVTAHATGTRRIVSKLAPHLEPGTLAQLRIVRRSPDCGARIVDALEVSRMVDGEFMCLVRGVALLAPELERDIPLFTVLRAGVVFGIGGSRVVRPILARMGFDPVSASCASCGARSVAYFVPEDILFVCRICARRLPEGREVWRLS